MTRILFIINPKAGQKTIEEFDQALVAEIKKLDDSGTLTSSIEKLIPESPEQIRTTLRQKFSDILGVVGGYGTTMEVLSVLVEFPTVKLSLIAYGTGNLLAANLGIPKEFSESIDTLFNDKARKLKIKSSKMLSVQVDDNLIGTTPMEIEVIHNRQQVLVLTQALTRPELTSSHPQSLPDTLKSLL